MQEMNNNSMQTPNSCKTPITTMSQTTKGSFEGKHNAKKTSGRVCHKLTQNCKMRKVNTNFLMYMCMGVYLESNHHYNHG